MTPARTQWGQERASTEPPGERHALVAVPGRRCPAFLGFRLWDVGGGAADKDLILLPSGPSLRRFQVVTVEDVLSDDASCGFSIAPPFPSFFFLVHHRPFAVAVSEHQVQQPSSPASIGTPTISVVLLDQSSFVVASIMAVRLPALLILPLPQVGCKCKLAHKLLKPLMRSATVNKTSVKLGTEDVPSGAPIGKKSHKERLKMAETRLDVLEASLEELYQGQRRLLGVESSQEEVESWIERIESLVDQLPEDTTDSV
ncbi:hypothetical protein BHM03_00044737 [Ensete ventricosum]|nr:hypothetical protein BHM03_00044737 [Ensete ventricosum]